MELDYLGQLGVCVVHTPTFLLTPPEKATEPREPREPLELPAKAQSRGSKISKISKGTDRRDDRRDDRRHLRDDRRDSSRELKISKTLSQILRHRALEFDIEVLPDGFCHLDEVLACPWLSGLKTTQADVERIVAGNDKKRFELKGDGRVMIRAVQGHSMKVVDDSQLLQTMDLKNLPDCCVHGTYRKHFESIKRKGLLAGGRQGQSYRNHVHFSSFNPGDERVISGMRYDCQIAIWIDLKKAVQDGVPFYISTNQVILSPGINGVIDKKYFTHARDLQNKEDLSLTD
jgi:RNA:NAD 2'-phosphotransferase (TPT1/KptA family)